MEIILKAFIYHNPEDVEEFGIRINEHNYKIICERIKVERYKIINYFKLLKGRGLIKSIHDPINKQMQKNIDYLQKVKREGLVNIRKIREAFN